MFVETGVKVHFSVDHYKLFNVCFLSGIKLETLEELPAECVLKIFKQLSISYLKLWMFTMTGLMPVRRPTK